MALAQRSHSAAVGERLVDGEVDAVAALLHRRPVERALPALRAEPPALRALPRGVVDTVLDEQELDAAVRRRFERLLPARCRPAVSACFLAPALGGVRFLLRAPALEHRLDRLQQLGRARVCLGGRPPDERAAHLVGELVLERGPRVFRADEHHAGAALPPNLPVEQLSDVAQVVVDQLLDVPLVARLRPAALVMPAGLLVEALLDLLAPAVGETLGSRSRYTLIAEPRSALNVARSRSPSQLTVAAIYLASPCRNAAILRLDTSAAAVRPGTASDATSASASAPAEAANATVNPVSVGSRFAPSVAVTIPAATWLPIAPPIVRTIV